MPVDQAPSRPAKRAPDDAKVVRYHDYIDQKIETTRRMVKVVDLATSLVELTVAILLFLLLAVVVEHWLVPSGFPVAVRVVLFGVLVAGIGYFAIRRLWPLCIRAINPVYAAQTIEHGSPTLKNGLINLLLFRQRRSEIPDAVYHTLEEQAAHGLTRVPVDTAVDRSELIHLGYVLIAIVAVAAIYKVLSPKDPLVAAERVLMPWAHIVPASRVTITDIKPGAATISQGEIVDVSADIRGLSEDESVVLRYTTDDGQIVGRAIPMRLGDDGLRFSCRLSDENGGSSITGVTRNLKYRLEAGDARSLDYPITVVPAPTILVDRVDYDYPAYTGYVDHSVDGIGDIRAIEGTRITIHARTNGIIRDAQVDFDADGRPDLQMTTAERKAHASFDLGLRKDRQTPLHASYVLRFTNDEGRANHDPVKHSIDVEPDLQPEVAIRLPQEKLRDVRADEKVMIEVEARDPDFALSAVRLRGEVAGRQVIDEPLLKGEHRGQFDDRYALVPSARSLKAGDVLEYWVEADDNRAPKPNTAVSVHKTLRIISPNPAKQPPGEQAAKKNRQQPQQGEQHQQQQGDQQQGNQQQDNQQGNGNQGQNNQGGNAGSNDSGKPNGQGQQGSDEQNQKKNNSQGQSDNTQPGGSGSDQQAGKADEKNQSGDLKQNQEGSGHSGNAKQHDGGQGQSKNQSVSNEPSPNQADQQRTEGQQSGTKGANGERSKTGAQSSDGQQGANQQDKSSGAQQNGERQKDGSSAKARPQNGQDQHEADENQPPVSSEGDNDAEAFHRIQKHMQQNGELKSGENSAKEEGDKDDQKSGAKEGEKQSDEGGRGDKERGRQGDSTENPAQKNQDTNSQQSQGANSKENGSENRKGAETRRDNLKQKGESTSDQQKEEKSPGGEQTAPKGSAGGGNDEKNEGVPNSKPETKPTEKPEPSSSKSGKSDQQEPPAGANSKRESDSHGDAGGDKSGGGAEGGGQKSPHDGTGSAGQNQPADQGSGKSEEKGAGEKSSGAGQDTKSDHPTGASDETKQGEKGQQREGAGDKAGGKTGLEKSGDKKMGSGDDSDSKQQQPSDGGDQQGAKPKQGDKETVRQGDKQPGQQGEKPGKKSAEKQQGENSQQQHNTNNSDTTNGGASGGSGQPGNAVNPQPSITGEAPPGDAANLEYARKQTDLVLEKLGDQLKRKQMDDGLLKDLGWSEADLKRFVERWQQRKEAAERNDEAGESAKRELDDALRSLGLQPGDLKQNAVQKDTMRDLHEGYRGPVPAQYKDRLRAYNQGISRARQEGE